MRRGTTSLSPSARLVRNGLSIGGSFSEPARLDLDAEISGGGFVPPNHRGSSAGSFSIKPRLEAAA